MLDSTFRMCIAGPSGAGKTFFLFDLLEKRAELIKPTPKNIYFFYGVKQKVFHKYPYITFIEGLPDINMFSDEDLDGSIIVIDDQMENIDQSVVSLYSKHSHHKNFSAVFLTQSFYYRGNKFTRDLTLNCNVLIMFDTPRDRGIIANLSRQLYPGNSNFLTSVFSKIIETPYAYIYIDLRVGVPEPLRIRTRVLEDAPVAFLQPNFDLSKWNKRKA
jgi:hypothetical protein